MRRPPLGARLFRLLLRGLAAPDREYGPEMLAVVVQRRRLSRSSPATVFWTRELVALGASVIQSQIDHWRAAQGRGPASWAFEARILMRTLARAPVFSISVVATLAIGIGAPLGIGELAWESVLAPLPFEDPGRLVRLYHHADPTAGVSLDELEQYRREASAFAEVAGWLTGEISYEPSEGAAQRLVRTQVSRNLFDVLGRAPILGGVFTERTPSAAVLLSHGFWQTQLGADASVIGSTIRLGGVPHEIVGVLPRGVHVPGPEVQVYSPLIESTRYVDVLARLNPAVSLEAASAEVDAFAHAMPNVGGNGPDNGARGGSVESLQLSWRGDQATLMTASLIAAALLFLVTCANVSLLMRARSAEVATSLQIRRALGATRLDIVRLRLCEISVLGLVATGVGLGLGEAVSSALPTLVPELGRQWAVARHGLPVSLGVGFSAILVVIVLSRPLPSQREDVAMVATAVLVPAQLAFALVLLSGSFLLVRSVDALLDVELGYRIESVASARFSLSPGEYESAESQRRYFAELSEQLQAVGFEEAGLVSALPMTSFGGGGDVIVQSIDADSAVGVIAQRLADPAYFSVMQIPLVSGRMFGPSDRVGSPRVALVDDNFARRFFGSPGAAIGEQLRFFMGGDDWNQIVGVVGSVRSSGPQADERPIVYVPFDQRPTRGAHVVVPLPQTGPPPTDRIRAAALATDPRVPVSDVEEMATRLNASMAAQRAGSAVFATFSALAVFLAGLGSYSVSALAEQRRRKEMAIRFALGATPGLLAKTVLLVTLRSASIGVALGLVGSLLLGRGIESLLFGVTSTDTKSLAGATAIIGFAVLAATVPPVVRSLRRTSHHVL